MRSLQAYQAFLAFNDLAQSFAATARLFRIVNDRVCIAQSVGDDARIIVLTRPIGRAPAEIEQQADAARIVHQAQPLDRRRRQVDTVIGHKGHVIERAVPRIGTDRQQIAARRPRQRPRDRSRAEAVGCWTFRRRLGSGRPGYRASARSLARRALR
ncbi:MAG: hypothetical protein FJX11_03450 [Alphaproteobacteria bacterium]|nr:hypothetical protein [Alphaproteobacteria bacterium]